MACGPQVLICLTAPWEGASRAEVVEPRDDARPDADPGVSPHQDSKVLQADTDLTGIFNDLKMSVRHCGRKRRNRWYRSHFIRRIDDRKRGDCQRGGADERTFDRQRSMTEAVFPI